MKKILFVFALATLFSCSSEDPTIVEEEVNLIVNHFKVPAEFEFANNLLVQEQGDNFFVEVPFVRNFNPVLGVVYELQATKTTTTQPKSNVSVITYTMNAVISETPAGINDSFTVDLVRYNTRTEVMNSWVIGNDDAGYFLSGEIPLTCPNNCREVFNPNQYYTQSFKGRFKHGDNGDYILLETFK